jgi:bifunctional non-homologous end joining protein LigD
MSAVARAPAHSRDACTFDLIEIDDRDLRWQPLERRKAMLAQLVRKPVSGLVLNATVEEPGDIVFKHACALGCEGIVSKRLASRYRSGRSKDWLKFKNPNAPAVRREAEEDWGKER